MRVIQAIVLSEDPMDCVLFVILYCVLYTVSFMYISKNQFNKQWMDKFTFQLEFRGFGLLCNFTVTVYYEYSLHQWAYWLHLSCHFIKEVICNKYTCKYTCLQSLSIAGNFYAAYNGSQKCVPKEINCIQI